MGEKHTQSNTAHGLIIIEGEKCIQFFYTNFACSEALAAWFSHQQYQQQHLGTHEKTKRLASTHVLSQDCTWGQLTHDLTNPSGSSDPDHFPPAVCQLLSPEDWLCLHTHFFCIYFKFNTIQWGEMNENIQTRCFTRNWK